MSTPDARIRLYESQQVWQAAQQAPGYGGEQGLPTHEDEMTSAPPSNSPPISVQSQTHGSPLPPEDRGPDPRGGVVG
jgi:hypothetical protein